MIDLVWESMKQQNFLHHVILLLVSLIGLLGVGRWSYRLRGASPKQSRILIPLVAIVIFAAWTTLLHWSAWEFAREIGYINPNPNPLVALPARAVIGGWLLILYLTATEPQNDWNK